MNTNNKLRYFKSALAFSFCFSFTDFQLETVSKVFHITFEGFAFGREKFD